MQSDGKNHYHEGDDTMDKHEREWRKHCAEMMRLHDEKAAELMAAGWRTVGRGRQVSYTRNGERCQLRRKPGSSNWYTVTL